MADTWEERVARLQEESRARAQAVVDARMASVSNGQSADPVIRGLEAQIADLKRVRLNLDEQVITMGYQLADANAKATRAESKLAVARGVHVPVHCPHCGTDWYITVSAMGMWRRLRYWLLTLFGPGERWDGKGPT